MTFEVFVQIVSALLIGAISGGVGHLWLKTERLDREQARHAEKFDSFAQSMDEVKNAVLSLTDKVDATATGVARIEGTLTNGFAKAAKAPTRKR